MIETDAPLPVVIIVQADHLWLATEDAARLLGFTLRQFREDVATRPGFPAPLRVDGTGHPKWNAGELHAWAKAERDKHAGRPRRGFRRKAA